MQATKVVNKIATSKAKQTELLKLLLKSTFKTIQGSCGRLKLDKIIT